MFKFPLLRIFIFVCDHWAASIHEFQVFLDKRLRIQEFRVSLDTGTKIHDFHGVFREDGGLNGIERSLKNHEIRHVQAGQRRVWNSAHHLGIRREAKRREHPYLLEYTYDLLSLGGSRHLCRSLEKNLSTSDDSWRPSCWWRASPLHGEICHIKQYNPLTEQRAAEDWTRRSNFPREERSRGRHNVKQYQWAYQKKGGGGLRPVVCKLVF